MRDTNLLVKITYLSKKQDHQKEKIVVNTGLLLHHFSKTKIINTDKYKYNLISQYILNCICWLIMTSLNGLLYVF